MEFIFTNKMKHHEETDEEGYCIICKNKGKAEVFQATDSFNSPQKNIRKNMFCSTGDTRKGKRRRKK